MYPVSEAFLQAVQGKQKLIAALFKFRFDR